MEMSKKDQELLREVRDMAKRLLDEGHPAPEVSFALTFIATEMGFAISEETIAVIPVVLSAVTQATAQLNDADSSIDEALDDQMNDKHEASVLH